VDSLQRAWTGTQWAGAGSTVRHTLLSAHYPDDLGRSPRMVRYLEEHGVLRPERGPGPGGHRHFPPPPPPGPPEPGPDEADDAGEPVPEGWR
jgi:hypothetical protein